MAERSDGKRVLVIDDESHILHVVSLKLRNAGFEVVTASDGEEGYEAALQYAPDLIITDYQMPYMTGVELCEKFCNSERAGDTPALLLTARGFSLEQTDLSRTNIVGVLSKPFSPREVLTRVQQLADEGSLQRT